MALTFFQMLKPEVLEAKRTAFLFVTSPIPHISLAISPFVCSVSFRYPDAKLPLFIPGLLQAVLLPSCLLPLLHQSELYELCF